MSIEIKDKNSKTLTEQYDIVNNKKKLIQWCLIALNILCSLLIPVFLTISDRVKQRDLNDHY